MWISIAFHDIRKNFITFDIRRPCHFAWGRWSANDWTQSYCFGPFHLEIWPNE